MISEQELKAILDRIAAGKQNEADMAALKDAVIIRGDENVLQLGKYNIINESGQNIQIIEDNRIIYQGADAEAIKEALRLVLQDKQKALLREVDAANILLTKLKNARLQGQEGDRKTGSFYTYNVWLEDVCVEKSHDSTENNRHIQKYTIQGKWNSKVYKEINVFGLRVDKPWGLKKKPHGNFTVAVEILNGLVTQIKVDAARHNDSANNYAADKVEQLINSKISPNK